jgi:hypothetical protein
MHRLSITCQPVWVNSIVNLTWSVLLEILQFELGESYLFGSLRDFLGAIGLSKVPE